VSGHDPRGDLSGAGVFGPTGSPHLGNMFGSGALIADREPVVAVSAQRHPVDATMPRPAGIGELSSRRSALGPASRPRVLPCRGTVLVGVGVAARPIQCLLARSGPVGGPRRSLLLLSVLVLIADVGG
jgi:hypothetical protein